MSTRTAPSSILTSAVIVSRYLSVWIAIVLLVLVALAPATPSRASFSAVLKRNGQLLDVDFDRVRELAYASRDYVVSESASSC